MNAWNISPDSVIAGQPAATPSSTASPGERAANRARGIEPTSPEGFTLAQTGRAMIDAGFSGFWIHGFSVRASHPGLLVEDVEQLGPLGQRGARYRRRPLRAGVGVAPVACRQRACRRRCFSGAWPTRTSEESQRAWSRFQTLRERYAAMGDWEGKLKRCESILRLRLNSSKVRCPPTRQFLRRLPGRSFDHFPY